MWGTFIMAIKKIGLSWITISDFKKSEYFFVNTLGLKVLNKSPEYGWLELTGVNGGAVLGVGQCMEDNKAGSNAVVTFTVDDIEETKENLENKGVKVSEIMEVPGHVKLANFADHDGNLFQLAEEITKK